MLLFGSPKPSRERLSFGSPNDVWELTWVPPGQALRIGCFSVPRKTGGNSTRSPGIPGERGFLKTYQGTGHSEVEINSMIDRHTLQFIFL